MLPEKLMLPSLRRSLRQVGQRRGRNIPFSLYYSKVQKFGMVSLTGLICGILMLLTGMG